MKIFMMLLLAVCVTTSYGSISDVYGIASDGIISDGEYGSNVKVSETSVLTFEGGGAEHVRVFDNAHVTVASTKTPLSGYYDGGGGIYRITPSDYSSVTVSGGIVQYIYVGKNSTVFLDGGQINLIQSIQYASVGKSITIDCQKDSWSWIGEGEDITGITGTWHNGNDFSIEFLNADVPLFPDTWKHVDVIPEPASMVLLGVGGIFLKKRRS